MFNLGFAELIVIAAVGLIVLGPDRFPKAARQIARFVNELKRVFSDAKRMSGFNAVQKETDKIIKETVSCVKDASAAPSSAADAGGAEEAASAAEKPPERRASSAPASSKDTSSASASPSAAGAAVAVPSAENPSPSPVKKAAAKKKPDPGSCGVEPVHFCRKPPSKAP